LRTWGGGGGRCAGGRGSGCSARETAGAFSCCCWWGREGPPAVGRGCWHPRRTAAPAQTPRTSNGAAPARSSSPRRQRCSAAQKPRSVRERLTVNASTRARGAPWPSAWRAAAGRGGAGGGEGVGGGRRPQVKLCGLAGKPALPPPATRRRERRAARAHLAAERLEQLRARRIAAVAQLFHLRRRQEGTEAPTERIRGAGRPLGTPPHLEGRYHHRVVLEQRLHLLEERHGDLPLLSSSPLGVRGAGSDHSRRLPSGIALFQGGEGLGGSLDASLCTWDAGEWPLAAAAAAADKGAARVRERGRGGARGTALRGPGAVCGPAPPAPPAHIAGARACKALGGAGAAAQPRGPRPPGLSCAWGARPACPPALPRGTPPGVPTSTPTVQWPGAPAGSRPAAARGAGAGGRRPRPAGSGARRTPHGCRCARRPRHRPQIAPAPRPYHIHTLAAAETPFPAPRKPGTRRGEARRPTPPLAVRPRGRRARAPRALGGVRIALRMHARGGAVRRGAGARMAPGRRARRRSLPAPRRPCGAAPPTRPPPNPSLAPPGPPP
jgi:hypothetical protein